MAPDVTDTQLNDAVDELIELAVGKAMDEADPRFVPEMPTEDDLRGQLGWVKPAFEWFLTPVPADFDTLIARAGELEKMFSGTADGDSRLDGIAAATGNLTNWTGATADSLGRNHLTPMVNVAANHGVLGHSLRTNAEAMKAVYANGRRNALAIATRGIDAIDSITECHGADLAIALTTAVEPTMTSTPLFPENSGSALASARLAESGGDRELPVGSDDVQGVMDNIRKVLDEAKRIVGDDEDRVLSALKDGEQLAYQLLGAEGDGSGRARLAPPEIDA